MVDERKNIINSDKSFNLLVLFYRFSRFQTNPPNPDHYDTRNVYQATHEEQMSYQRKGSFCKWEIIKHLFSDCRVTCELSINTKKVFRKNVFSYLTLTRDYKMY